MSYFTDKEIVILNKNYATATNLRGVLLNIFNNSDYPKTDIGQIIYDADKEHLDLFHKILKVNVEYINGSQIFKDIKRLSYDKEGYDKEGYDEEGYNKEGFDRQGSNGF